MIEQIIGGIATTSPVNTSTLLFVSGELSLVEPDFYVSISIYTILIFCALSILVIIDIIRRIFK